MSFDKSDEYELDESVMNMLDLALDTMIQAASNVAKKPIGPEIYSCLQLLATEIAVSNDVKEAEFVEAAKKYYYLVKSEYLKTSSQLN